MVTQHGIRTQDIERINRFSQFITQLGADFNWVVCQQYLGRREKLVRLMADHWQQDQRSTRQDIDNRIEKGGAAKLHFFARKTLTQRSDGSYQASSLQRKTLADCIQLAGMQIASLFEAIRSLKYYRDYYIKKESELLSLACRLSLTQKKQFLTRLDNLTGDLSTIIPQLTAMATQALMKMKQFIEEFSIDYESRAEKMFVISKENEPVKFCLAASLFSNHEPCKTNLPIYLDGETTSLEHIHFDNADIYASHKAQTQRIQLKKCTGNTFLSGVRDANTLRISDCPTLSIEVIDSNFQQVQIQQYIDNIKLESVQAHSLELSANTSQLILQNCQIKQTHVTCAGVDHLNLIHTSTRLATQNGSDIGYLALDASSTATVSLAASRVGRLKPGQQAHVIAHDSTIGEIDLQQTELAFIDQTRSQTTALKKNTGFLQEITAKDGSRYTLFSKHAVASNQLDQLDLSSQPPSGQAAYLTDLIANDQRTTAFFDLANRPETESSRRTLLKSAALALTRSGITPCETAWGEISALENQSFGSQANTLTALTQDVACADFMLWRADNFPEQHTAILAKLPVSKRIAALHYMKEMASRKSDEHVEIRQEMTHFHTEIAAIAVLAKAWRLIYAYHPGEMSPWSKHKAKNNLLQKLQRLITDGSLSLEEITKQSLLVFQESKTSFPHAWQQGRTLATFFGLAEQLIKQFQNISILARQIDANIELELKQKNSKLYRNVLARHQKRKQCMILTDAVSETIHEIQSIIQSNRDPEKITRFNTICARQATIQFQHELTESTQLEKRLNQIYQFASTYSPIFALSGPGKQKLNIMHRLAQLANDKSKSATHRHRELIISLDILRQKGEPPQKEMNHLFAAGSSLWQKRSRDCRGYKSILNRICDLVGGSPGQAGGRRWGQVQRQEENQFERQDEDQVQRQEESQFERQEEDRVQRQEVGQVQSQGREETQEYRYSHFLDFWPQKQQAGDIDHFAVPGMDQAMLIRQENLFKKRQRLRKTLDDYQKTQHTIPIIYTPKP